MARALRRLFDGLEVVSRTVDRPTRPEVLFLHGNWMGAWVWDAWAEAFARHGHPSHAVSYPGHGGSPALAEPAFLALGARDLVRRLGAVRAALGGPPVLVGHSLGGLMAQALAAEGGAAALVLIASAAPAGRVSPRPLRPADRPVVLDRAEARRLLVHDVEDASFDALFARLGPGATGLLNSSGGRLALDGARVRCPTLVVTGALDASSVPPGEVLADAYGADLVVLPDTGHTPMIERRSDAALAAILAWLDRALAPRPGND